MRGGVFRNAIRLAGAQIPRTAFRHCYRNWPGCRAVRAGRAGLHALETVWKLYSGGHLMAFSALPVLTDQNVRCAPVLETTTI
ncbi:MAG: hypothetical protein E5Y32_27585 [Mesorhizobium sp.]|nr:MAG: hypothetical protein E5Y32_27585 [Mesorhizobium sp.]